MIDQNKLETMSGKDLMRYKAADTQEAQQIDDELQRRVSVNTAKIADDVFSFLDDIMEKEGI